MSGSRSRTTEEPAPPRKKPTREARRALARKRNIARLADRDPVALQMSRKLADALGGEGEGNAR